MRLLITGGAGFIGSHVTRHFAAHYPDYQLFNLDKLTYAGNLANLSDLEGAPNYTFVRGDIADAAFVNALFAQYNFDAVLHLAAESHVDRSILEPSAFVVTNVIGTVNLLNAARAAWADNFDGKLFYHVSTDEVYGTLGAEGHFTETTAYDPHSPYSASKASSDHFVRAYGDTYGLPFVLSNCSNNYGPNQFPEKLIPVIILNIVHQRPLPVYGKGENVRDWLWVCDHVAAIDRIFHQGARGRTYNIGGDNEWRNIDLVRLLCRLTDEALDHPHGSAERLITYVTDRPGHDLRYAIDASRLKSELDWAPQTSFEAGLRETIRWYLDHPDWINGILTKDYLSYYERQYGGRLA